MLLVNLVPSKVSCWVQSSPYCSWHMYLITLIRSYAMQLSAARLSYRPWCVTYDFKFILRPLLSLLIWPGRILRSTRVYCSSLLMPDLSLSIGLYILRSPIGFMEFILVIPWCVLYEVCTFTRFLFLLVKLYAISWLLRLSQPCLGPFVYAYSRYHPWLRCNWAFMFFYLGSQIFLSNFRKHPVTFALVLVMQLLYTHTRDGWFSALPIPICLTVGSSNQLIWPTVNFTHAEVT